MTYRELLHYLEELEDEQLDNSVMAHVDEEFFKVNELKI